MPSPSDTNLPSSDSEGSPRLQQWGRRVLWGLGTLIGTGLLLVGLLLLVLQTDTGATRVAQFLAPRVNPMSNTTLSVEQASGNWIQSLRLTNVSLTRPDSASGRSVSMAHIDTLAVQYRLGALLQGRLHLTSVSVDAPSIRMQQDPDSTWDWARLVPQSEAAPDDTSAAAMSVQIDRLHVGRGQFSAAFYAGGRDSIARVQELELRARDVHLGPSYEGHLDTLGLRGQPPTDTTALRLATTGSLSSRRLQLDTLRLTSPRSQVIGHGVARLPLSPNAPLDDVSLSLHTAPLVLGDLTAFVPTLAVDPQEAIDLDAHLTGSGQRLSLTTEVRVHSGGTLDAEVEATPRIEPLTDRDSLRYRMEAQAHRLTTSLLGPSDSTQNVISATIEGTLEGRALEALSGTLRAQITDTRLYDLRTSETTVQSTFKKGTADVNLRGILNEAPLSITGTAHPFDAAPSADLTAKIRNLSLAAVAPDADINGSITATARLTGQSIATSDATYDVDATLQPSQIESQRIEAGRLRLAVRPEELSVDGSLRLPRGRMQVLGSALLDGSEQFTLERGRFDDVNLAALLGDPTESRVTGTVRAQGRGFSPATMQGRGTLTISNAHYGPHQMSALNTQARLDEGRLSTEMSARINGGQWTLSVLGRPFAAVPSVELTDGRFRNVDIGPFLQDTTQSSALHGTVRGRVQGTTASTLQFDGGLTLESSRLNRQKISGASLNATLKNAVLQSTLTLDTPDGSARFQAEARPFEDLPSLQISDGSFSNLNAGALAQVSGLNTALSGRLSLTARGTDPSRLTLDSELTLQESTLNRAALPEGRLSVNAEAGRVETTGTFSVAGGSLQLEGHLDSLGHTPTYTLETTARSLDVGALAGLDSLETSLRTAQWTVNGRGTALDSLTASTQFSADSVRVDRVHIHSLTLAGALDHGLFRVDTLSAHSNVGTVQGGGPLGLTPNAAASKFALRATMRNAGPLRSLVGAPSLQLQKSVLNAHVYGTAGEQRFDGTLELNGFIYDDYRLSNVKASFDGNRGASRLLGRLNIDAKAGYLSAFGLAATQTRVQSVYDGTTVELSSDVELDPTHKVSLSTSFRPLADSIDLRVQQFNVRMGPDRWSLQQETTITIGDTYRVDELLLESGPQRLEADGVVNPTGSQDLRVAMKEVHLGGLAPLLGFTGLDGQATGTLVLTGPASTPSFKGRLNVALQSQQDDVGTLRLNVGYDDLAVTLDARLTHQNGSVLTLAGSVPADLRLQAPTTVNVSDRSVRLDASTDQFPINWIDPFLDPETLRSVTGTLTADAEIRGTPNQPDLSGTISVSNLGASLPSLKTKYRDGSARLKLRENELTVTESRIRSPNGGSLSLTGLINFPQLTVGEYDLTINASNFLAINTPAYRRGVIDGQMTLRGTVQRPVLNGDVQIQSASVYYAEALAESEGAMSTVSLRSQDQLTLEERFGVRLTASDTTTFDMYQALAMDLTVEIESDTWLRSNGTPEMNIQFTGDLDVQKSLDQDPRIFGTIDVLGERSTLRQFGQEFQISEGILTFNGDPSSPYLNLTAIYEQRARGTQGTEVTITLSLSGRPENLSPTLTSNPPMDTRNILSYLATGRPANSLFSGTSEGGNLATQVALGQATNFVENLAASELGLDVVQLQVRPEGASYLTVGRYLTPRFFASIEQPVLTSSSQTATQTAAFIPDVTLEYRFTDYLLMRSRSNQQSLGLNLLFQYAY